VVLVVNFPVSIAGSEYLEVVHERVGGVPMKPNLACEKEHADMVRRLIVEGLVDTAHDVSGGGLAVALAEMAIAGGIGMEFQEKEIEPKFGLGRKDLGLFGETGAHFLITASEERWRALQDALVRAHIPYDDIGRTGGDRLKIPGLIDLGLAELRAAYERDLFGAPGGAEVAH
jgi:phosphoribosylformylglycinamidine synthase